MTAPINELRLRAGNKPVERRMRKSLDKDILCPFHKESTGSFGAFRFPDGTPGFKCWAAVGVAT